MKKNTLKTRILAVLLAIVTMTTFASFFAARPLAAEQAGQPDIYTVADKTLSKTEELIKVLTDISKSPAYKEALFAYFGPCMSVLGLMLPPEKKTSLDDISKKLDEINAEIQGKITKEADRIISAMDAIPDIIDVRNAKRNITSLKMSIENAQNNIGVDLDSKTKTAEQKLREVASELGDNPKDWGLGSTINAVEVLAEDITVKDTDVATAVETNSFDNLYVSMYRYQCTKSVFSGEAIDRSADFVNSTYGIYLNCATTVLQYLNAKAQIAVIDNDEDMLKKVNIKIDSFLDDMIAAAEAISEFFSLNRITFVGGRSDAGEHIRIEKEIATVNHEYEKVEDIDAVFKGSALSYDEVKSVIAKAKETGAGSMAEYLRKAGFAVYTNGNSYLVTGKGFMEGGTISVPFKCLYNGVELSSAPIAETAVKYHQYRVDRDSLNVYDKQWFGGNAMFFRQEPARTYEIFNLTSEDFDSFKAYMRCRETGTVFTTDNVKAVRTDDGENGQTGTFAATAYFEGRAYTGTYEVSAKMYTVKNIDGRTVLTLNWGNFANFTIDWASVGGREAVNEIRIRKGVAFFADCSGLFRDLVNCEIIETENAATSGIYNLNGMFAGCAALRELDLSGFNTSTVRDFTDMFNGCTALQSLDLSGFTVSPTCFRTQGMFENCISLARLVLSANISVTADMGLHAKLDGFHGWARENDPDTVITGKDKIAVFSGEGTFIRV